MTDKKSKAWQDADRRRTFNHRQYSSRFRSRRRVAQRTVGRHRISQPPRELGWSGSRRAAVCRLGRSRLSAVIIPISRDAATNHEVTARHRRRESPDSRLASNALRSHDATAEADADGTGTPGRRAISPPPCSGGRCRAPISSWRRTMRGWGWRHVPIALRSLAFRAKRSSSIILIEPVSGIERQEFDHSSLWPGGRLVDDESPALHSRLQRHVITRAPRPSCHKPADARFAQLLHTESYGR